MSNKIVTPMKVGLFGGGIKPFHRGHHGMILEASKETDVVYLFVSVKDRTKKSEFPIRWERMEIVWREYLVPVLPKNVLVSFVLNPTDEIYKTLESANNNPNDVNTYVLYGRPKDIENCYPSHRLKRNVNKLCSDERLVLRGLVAGSCSGTEMRQHLANKDLSRFTVGLPDSIQKHAKEIFDLLTSESF